MSSIHAMASDVAGLHNVGMIEAQKDHYLIQTLPSFSMTFFNMGFIATSCVIPWEGREGERGGADCDPWDARRRSTLPEVFKCCMLRYT